MFCSQCGAEVAQNSNFCGKCGAKIQNISDQVKEPGSKSGGHIIPGGSPPHPSTVVLAQCPAALYDKDITGTMGITQAEGILLCYDDHLEYKVKLGGSLSPLFGIAGVLVGTAMAKDKNTACIPYSEIATYKVVQYALGQPAIVLQLKSGKVISYVNGLYQKEKINKCAEIIKANMNKSDSQAESISQTADNTIPVDSNPQKESNQEKITVQKRNCTFVMSVRNTFSITGQGVAANGTVEKGTVSVGDEITLADSEMNVKSTHKIFKIASGNSILETTPEDGGTVSLLFADCQKEQLSVGDYIFKATPHD